MAVVRAVAAALTFGVSAPIAKLLLDVTSPLLLAGLLYLGAGLFLTVVRSFGARWLPASRRLAPADRWLLLGAVAAGGILAPPLLFWGLARSPASATALLLNLEVVFTALLAGTIFGERLGPRVVAGAGLMAVAGAVLSWPGDRPDVGLPALAVAGACLLWAIDNNVTRLIADADAVLVAQVKGLVAGGVNTVVALASGETAPSLGTVAASFGLGALSYGTSLVLFILAMRDLGAARAGVYFSLAPFFGAAGAVGLLHEPVTTRLAVSGALMGAGIWLLGGERHTHRHRHGTLEHEHPHVHDRPHDHQH